MSPFKTGLLVTAGVITALLAASLVLSLTDKL